MPTPAHVTLTYPLDEARSRATRERRRRRLQLLALALGPSLSLSVASVLPEALLGNSPHTLLLVIAIAWLPHGVSFPALLRQDELAARARRRRQAQGAESGARPGVARTIADHPHLVGAAQLVGTLLGAVMLACLW